MNMIDGLKSYGVALSMVMLGCVLLLMPGEPTYADPQAGTVAAVARVVGWVSILLGAQTASLRHAMSKLERRLPRAIRHD